MQNKVAILLDSLVEKTKTGLVSWQAEPHPYALKGSVLLAHVAKHSLRLSEREGLQVYHLQAWEAVTQDSDELIPLLEATGLVRSPDAELVELIDAILNSNQH
jgi:hypothetical protein